MSFFEKYRNFLVFASITGVAPYTLNGRKLIRSRFFEAVSFITIFLVLLSTWKLVTSLVPMTYLPKFDTLGFVRIFRTIDVITYLCIFMSPIIALFINNELIFQINELNDYPFMRKRLANDYSTIRFKLFMIIYLIFVSLTIWLHFHIALLVSFFILYTPVVSVSWYIQFLIYVKFAETVYEKMRNELETTELSSDMIKMMKRVDYQLKKFIESINGAWGIFNCALTLSVVVHMVSMELNANEFGLFSFQSAQGYLITLPNFFFFRVLYCSL